MIVFGWTLTYQHVQCFFGEVWTIGGKIRDKLPHQSKRVMRTRGLHSPQTIRPVQVAGTRDYLPNFSKLRYGVCYGLVCDIAV